MKKLNRLTVSLLPLLLAAMAPVHAADNTMTQATDRTQTREMSQDRVQINLRTPASDFDQVHNQEQNREQHRLQQQSKHQNRMMERSMHDISVSRSMSRPAAPGGGGMAKGR